MKNYIKMKITRKYFMSTSQSSKKLLRKSAKTGDKSNKPKSTVIATKFVNDIRSYF